MRKIGGKQNYRTTVLRQELYNENGKYERNGRKQNYRTAALRQEL